MHHSKQSSQYKNEKILTAAIIATIVGILVYPLIPGARATGSGSGVLARKLVDMGNVDRGLCAVIGGQRDLPVQIALCSNLLVHVREPDSSVVAIQRRLAEEAGLGIDRLIIEHGTLSTLPYADNVVDVVIATRADPGTLSRLSASEVLRVLRPEGKAIIVTASGTTEQEVSQWILAGRVQSGRMRLTDSGLWLRFSKPVPDGIDDWSHWEHSPDNNPVSTDQVIKAPYMTQFLAEPYYITMPAITTAAGGRTFLATGHIAHHEREWDMVNKLIARNGYNGIVLWKRDLPDGYLAHRSAFVATKDVFYMLDGDGCLMLDARTGAEKGRIHIPGLDGDWKWMAMKDGVLYAMAGDKGGEAKVIKGDRNFGGWSWADLSEGYYARPRVPWGFGSKVAAYKLDEKRVLWEHTEDVPIDSRALAMRDNKLFLYCPTSHLRSLNTETGKPEWTNSSYQTLNLIEQPGRGLTSTPGFRSACMAVAGPESIIIQGQTRMNVIAVSTKNGELLWQKKKITNNPNAIFLDDQVVLGVGPGSQHVAIDPVSGEVQDNYKFRKAACTRLTATPDSLFVRGEGTLRFDRVSKKILIDGGVRPACNDGALPANGMLYIGPWACDCNLSLIGAMAKCSAGDFRFDHVATETERLEKEKDSEKVEPLEVAAEDWPTYRANNQRTSSTKASLAQPRGEGVPSTALGTGPPLRSWTHTPKQPHVPTAPVSAGGIVFVAGDCGKVRAIDERTGEIHWIFATGGPIKAPPTIAESRAYVGSGDGYVYALEAATGRLLWRFRAAPVERHIMVYGNLCSTWPVNTGVLVEDGVAYFAAGIIDGDGTYVYALDAKTGKIKWQNNSCGHLNPELRKGVSAQGNLTIRGNELLMAGGNQVSPARFDIKTGKCLNQSFAQGNPKANHGRFVGVFLGDHEIAGGRALYASPENVANKDSFVVHNGRRFVTMNFGGIPPAWSDETIAMVNFRDGKLICCAANKARERIEKGLGRNATPAQRRWLSLADALKGDNAIRWTTDIDQKEFEVVSIVICPDSVVAVVKFQNRVRAHPEWFLIAFNSRNGTPYWFWRYPLSSKPLPGGLLVGRDGQIVVTMLDGTVRSFAPQQPHPAQQDRASAARSRTVRPGAARD